MIRYSDCSEVYITTADASTGKWLPAPSTAFCTKFEVMFSCSGASDYISNVSVLSEAFASNKRPSVRVANNSTMFSEWGKIEDALADYVSARDLLYHWEKHKQGRLASVYVVYFVEKNFSQMNLDVINSLLLSASPKRLTEWSMVALLRASFSAKHLLPGWNVFFNSVKEELRNNDRAPKLLAGLDQ